MRAGNLNRYFDYAASAPPYVSALDEFRRVSRDACGNPSSSHREGRCAREVLEAARREISRLAGHGEGPLVFTASGTEANNMVVIGAASRRPSGRLLIAGDSHPSVWFARELDADRVDTLPLDAAGRVTAAEVARCLRPDAALCSVLHANNETGVVNDVRAIASVCAERGVPCHVDGVQALGHLPFALSDLGANFYTFSAHKFGAPRGAGGLFVQGAQAVPLLHGGGHEHGLRAGTENVAAIAAARVALRESLASHATEAPRLRALADRFVAEVTRRCPLAILNSDPVGGLPGLVSVSFPGLLAGELVAELDLQGYALSAGSACHSNTVTPSRVLLAMGRPAVAALGTVRVSMGRHTTERSARTLADALCRAVNRHLALDTSR